MTAEEKIQAIEKLLLKAHPQHQREGFYAYASYHIPNCPICQIQDILGYERDEWTWTKKEVK